MPIRCVWGGFTVASHELRAATPGLWITSSGYRSLYGDADGNGGDVRHHFRHLIEKLAAEKDFKLVPLEPAAQDRCGEFLQQPENAWLREAIARGLVDPIRLPARLRAVQQDLVM